MPRSDTSSEDFEWPDESPPEGWEDFLNGINYDDDVTTSSSVEQDLSPEEVEAQAEALRNALMEVRKRLDTSHAAAAAGADTATSVSATAEADTTEADTTEADTATSVSDVMPITKRHSSIPCHNGVECSKWKRMNRGFGNPDDKKHCERFKHVATTATYVPERAPVTKNRGPNACRNGTECSIWKRWNGLECSKADDEHCKRFKH